MNLFTLCTKMDNHESIGEIILSVNEYETIRLIDYEGLTQSECTAQMLVARKTVQTIDDRTRKKLAIGLIEQKRLLLMVEIIMYVPLYLINVKDVALFVIEEIK